jgi:hypothetical protein
MNININCFELFYKIIKSIYRILRDANFSLINKLNSTQSYQRTLQILGNGQSLSENKFTENDYMVVNRHVLSSNYEEIKPLYYVIADPHFFSHSEGISILNLIEKKTTWKMKLYIPWSKTNKKLIMDVFGHNHNIDVCFYNNIYFTGYKKIKYCLYNKNIVMPRAQNVLVACIYIAICRGYKNIELYGVEHSWTKYLYVDDLNQVCLYNPHFYDKKEIKAKTWQEIHHTSTITIAQVLRIYALMFDAYHDLKEYADFKNCEIINFTKTSFIDAFKRTNIHK